MLTVSAFTNEMEAKKGGSKESQNKLCMFVKFVIYLLNMLYICKIAINDCYVCYVVKHK